MVDPIQWFQILSDPSIWPSVQIILGLNIFILNSLWIEKYLLATELITEDKGWWLEAINAASVIIVPAYVVYTENVHPVGSSMALTLAAIVFLKMISYHHVNFWCRKDLKKRFQSLKAVDSYKQLRRYRSFSHNGSENDLSVCAKTNNNGMGLTNFNGDEKREIVYYPGNLNYKDVYYFVCVPTLCYELNFPRSERIRKRFLIRRGFEMVSCSNDCL